MFRRRWMRAIALGVMVLLCGVVHAATIDLAAGGGEKPPGGPAIGTKLIEPFAVAFDNSGNWYICEHKGERIHRVTPGGVLSIFAGRQEAGYSGDGGPAAQATFRDPHGIVITPDQQMYVADTRNHVVRKIDLETGLIKTVAGTGAPGYSGDGGPAAKAQFHGTYAIALDPQRPLLYVADLDNRRVRRVDLSTGIVTTVAGNSEEGVPKNGALAAEAPLVDPRAIAADSAGNVYILERRGNALRRVDVAGRIQTLIAPGDLVLDMKGPKHLTVDLEDKVIIADAENHLIRKYDPVTGVMATIAGTGQPGGRIVREDPLKTQLRRPHGVYVHSSGEIYISDSYNHRVLRLKP